MASNRRGTAAQFGVAVRAMVFLTLLLGLVYPLAMTGAAQALFHANANGSMVQVDGKDVASDLIGQAYTKQAVKDGKPEVGADGEPVMEADPLWFQTRPSAVDYDGAGQRGFAVRAEQRRPAGGDRGTAADGRGAGRRRSVAGPAGRCDCQQQRTRPCDQSGVRRAAGRPGRAGTRSRRGHGAAVGEGQHQGPHARLPRGARRQRRDAEPRPGRTELIEAV